MESVADEEYVQKEEAAIQMMKDLNAGLRSEEQEGWISEEAFLSHFRNRVIDE